MFVKQIYMNDIWTLSASRLNGLCFIYSSKLTQSQN